MNTFDGTVSYIGALDFSSDSRIRDPLLTKIGKECFGALEDDELDFLNAAGAFDEGGIYEKKLYGREENPSVSS